MVTTASDSGPGSLRDTIAAANPGATITFAPSVGSITLTSGQLEMTKTLTVVGQPNQTQVISGGGRSRVLSVDVPAGAVPPAVTLANLTITNGHAPDGTRSGDITGSSGGGLTNNGGILTINQSVIISNTAGAGTSGDIGATVGGSGGAGGAIMNTGVLTISQSLIMSNTAGAGGDSPFQAGPGGAGGGLVNNGGMVLMSQTTIASNATGKGGNGTGFGPNAGNGGPGGGIVNNQGILTVISSTITGNTTGQGGDVPAMGPRSIPGFGGSGAGIDDQYSPGNLGTVSISASTLSTNPTGLGGTDGFGSPLSGAGEGGGLYNDFNSGSLTVNNSTISGNAGGQGAGIFNGASAVTIHASTISGNRASNFAGGIFSNNNLSIGASILAGNVASLSPDCYSTVTSLGYNLVENLDRCALTGDTTGNITGIAPQLAPLANNGGPTATQALSATSSARDQIPAARCAVLTDQRGDPRPDEPEDSGFCDIGAYESGPPPQATLVVNPARAVPPQTLTLTATAFTPGELVTLFWESPVTVLSTTIASATGSIVTAITALQAISGTHTLIAVGQTSHLMATAPVTIVPFVVVRPSAGVAGAVVGAIGLGFAATEAVALVWDRPLTYLAMATSNSVGSFGTLTVTVPSGASAGQHYIYALDRTRHAVVAIGLFTVR